MSLSEALGAIGVAILLVAFAGSSLGRLSTQAVPYQLMNLFGAALSCAASALIPFWPFVVLEGTWALVAAVALVRLVVRAAR